MSATSPATIPGRPSNRSSTDPGTHPDRVTDFVEATDFDAATILYLQSVGSSTCYNTIEVSNVSVTDESVVATASAVDTSGSNTACGPAITYPSAFVRVPGDDLPEATRVTLTSGYGTTGEVDAGGPLIHPDTLAGGVRPDGDPPAVPAALDCDIEGFERHPAYVDDDTIQYGTLTDDENPTFALRARNPDGDAIDDLTFARGDEIEFRLVNVSSEEVFTGSEHKYTLQLKTEAGWTEIRGTTNEDVRIGYEDIAFEQPPGEGLTWSLELTERGLLAGNPNAERLTICPDLQPGRYRLAYWGVPDGLLAVKFDYTD
jgi:hypothetical protein